MGIKLIILLSHLFFPTVKNRFVFYCIIPAKELILSSASTEMHVSENGCLITVNPPPPPRLLAPQFQTITVNAIPSRVRVSWSRRWRHELTMTQWYKSKYSFELLWSCNNIDDHWSGSKNTVDFLLSQARSVMWQQPLYWRIIRHITHMQ
jgi:hypothetical protein